jgi:hypothetical protein
MKKHGRSLISYRFYCYRSSKSTGGQTLYFTEEPDIEKKYGEMTYGGRRWTSIGFFNEVWPKI